MTDGGITVRGIPEVQRNLKDFPRLLVMGCFRKALARAAAVFEEELAARCPESDYSTSSEEYGHLIENIASQITIDTQGRGGKARIGFGKKGFLALWLEYGHRMVTHKGRQVGTVEATPFVRPAFEAAADRALAVFVEEVSAFLSDANKGMAA
jgi:hypothetical protein